MKPTADIWIYENKAAEELGYRAEDMNGAHILIGDRVSIVSADGETETGIVETLRVLNLADTEDVQIVVKLDSGTERLWAWDALKVA